jgi:pyruvate dehydrogenase E1 component beta subunit
MLEEYHMPGVDRILDAVDRLQWDDGAGGAGSPAGASR